MEAIIVLFFLVPIFICFSLLKERLEIKRLKKEGAAINDQIKKLREKREEEIRQAKLKPFNREEAEKAAKEYHKQKGQFLEIIDEKTKKEIRVKKIKELRKKVRELKRIDKENTKEAKSLEKNPKYSRTRKGNPKENKMHSKFIREVLFPLREKMYAAERELRDAEIEHDRNGEPLPEQSHSWGKRGGRYNLRVSKNGNYYRQYY